MHRAPEITGALLLAALGGCVGPERAAPQSLSGYRLPAASPKAPAAEPRPYPESAVSNAILYGCYAVGVNLCRTPAELSSLLQLKRPALSEVTHVVASCSAGSVTASLLDETIHSTDPSVIRQGRVHGRFQSHSGLEVYARGEFVLARTAEFDQMTVTIAAPAIASLTACYSEPRANSATALLSFRVSRGLLGAIFGVPACDTGVHVPIHPIESGMVSFKLDSGSAATIVQEAATMLPKDSFDATAVKHALEKALPLALCGVAPWHAVSKSEVPPSEELIRSLRTAVKLCERHKLPAATLLSGAEGTSPGLYEFRCLGISSSHAYVLTSITMDSTKELIQAFQTLQPVEPQQGLYRFDLGEFRSRIVRIEQS